MKKRTLLRFFADIFPTAPYRLFLAILLAGAMTAPLFGQATLSVQGVLKKSDGSAVPDDEYNLTFTLWESPSSTDVALKAWEGMLTGVETKGGVYSVVLGASNNSPALTAPFDKIYWLGVKIGNGQELFPRPQLTHAPYALALLGETNVFPSTGNVGIGTDSPTSATLVVDGTITSTGNAGIGRSPIGISKLAVKLDDVNTYGLMIFPSTGSVLFSVDEDGDIDTKGGLEVDGNANFSANQTVVGTSTFKGTTKFEDTNTFEGESTFKAVSTFHNSVYISGPIYVDGGLNGTSGYFGSYHYNDAFPKYTNELPVISAVKRWDESEPRLKTSIRVNGEIDALGYLTNSDQRIKKAFQHTASTTALNSLLQLQPTEYKYIDQVANGSRMVRGFVAQEVKEVVPEAVSYSVKFIPSIFAKPINVSLEAGKLRVEVAQTIDLKEGDKIRLLVGDAQEDVIVSGVLNDHTFTVDNWTKATEPMFVYGKEVDDFHVIDYNQITSLNVSATQELAKRLELLEKENAALKSENSALRSGQSSTTQLLENFAERLKILEAQAGPNGSK